MHVNYQILLLLALLNVYPAFAQYAEPSVVSSGGDSYKQISASMSFTIGEIATETFSKNNTTLTQGFHQGNIKVVKLESFINEDIAEIYPNPAQDETFLMIKNFKKGDLYFRIYDANSKMLLDMAISSNSTKIDMREYVQGIYFIKVFKSAKLISIYKIIKQ